MKTDEELNEYYEQKEIEAWNVFLTRTNLSKNSIAYDLVKSAFLAGYSRGSIDGNEEVFEFALNDPIWFHNELKLKNTKK